VICASSGAVRLRPLLFPLSGLGNAASMIGLAIALVVIGVIFLFFLPWVGIPVGIVGLVLLILWLTGFVRRRGTA
jgi:Flp pilus assembly protein TadB